MTLSDPSTLNDFVNTYDEVSHDDWDPEAEVTWDEYDEPEVNYDEEDDDYEPLQLPTD